MMSVHILQCRHREARPEPAPAEGTSSREEWRLICLIGLLAIGLAIPVGVYAFQAQILRQYLPILGTTVILAAGWWVVQCLYSRRK